LQCSVGLNVAIAVETAYKNEPQIVLLIYQETTWDSSYFWRIILLL